MDIETTHLPRDIQTYLENIRRSLKGCEKSFSVGDCPTCSQCFPDGYQEGDQVEPSFSKNPCDSCRSHFGGDRFPAHWLYTSELSETYGHEEKELIHCEVCVDCLAYHANGDLPETWRMMPAERNEESLGWAQTDSETLGHVFRLLKGETYNSAVTGSWARAINDECVLVKYPDAEIGDWYKVMPTEVYTLSPHYHDNKLVRLDHDKGLCREVHGKAQ